MTVGARDARLKRVGVRPEREKGVVERGGSVVPTAVTPGETDVMRGLGLRAAFSSPAAARFNLSCSDSISPVLAVLLFVPVCGFSPTTVPYIDPRLRA